VLDVLYWFVAVEILGVLAFPLAFVLFRRLPDRGFTSAKPLSMVLFSYVLWLLGLTQQVANSRNTVLFILFGGLIIAGWLAYRERRELTGFFRREWRTLVVAEGLFLFVFLLWAGVISGFPAINHTEKPMDFAFLNAVLGSRFFPPEDPWLSGNSISYYYFGHFMMAFLVKLSSVDSSVGYNLSISVVPALVSIGSFGILFNLVRLSGGSRTAGMISGLVAVVTVGFIGNSQGLLEFVHLRGWAGDGFWGWLGVKGLEGGVAGGAGMFPDDPWWWWRATRVIDTLTANGQSLDYTITEFPSFSFILGDLHPHVVSLPFALMFLSLGLNAFLLGDRLGFGVGWLRRHWGQTLGIAFLLGSLAFTNIWDYPVYLAIFGLIVFIRCYSDESSGYSRDIRCLYRRVVLNTVVVVMPIAVVAVVLFLPFYLDLSSQASGILPVTGLGTRPVLFLLVVGLFFLLTVVFLLRQLPDLGRLNTSDRIMSVVIGMVVAAPFILWTLAILGLGIIGGDVSAAFSKVGWRLLIVLPGLAIVAVAMFSATQRGRLSREPILAFPLILLAMAFYLLVGAELFFLVDLFGNRMNTVFKVYYQSWLLLAIVGSYGLYYWYAHSRSPYRWRRVGHYAWLAVASILIFASLYYPLGAVLDRTGIFNADYNFANHTLDGLAYLSRSDPAEYEAILWLRDQADRGRMVEAEGDDYTDHGRVSASTGLPTILGWPGHELQWRGTSQGFRKRSADIASIYQSEDSDLVRSVFERYGIRYVFVGPRERTKYGAQYLAGFGDLLRIVFEQDEVVVYETSPNLNSWADR